jgi:serine/threonine-protein kinase
LALTLGVRLGVYEISAQIGEGGMGQVYRARDTKLNRDVALKILPDAFASDPDRLARFTRSPNPRLTEPSQHRDHLPGSGRYRRRAASFRDGGPTARSSTTSGPMPR